MIVASGLGRRMGISLDCGMGTFGDKSGTVFAIALENFVRDLSRQCQLDRDMLRANSFGVVGADRTCVVGVGVEWGWLDGSVILSPRTGTPTAVGGTSVCDRADL